MKKRFMIGNTVRKNTGKIATIYHIGGPGMVENNNTYVLRTIPNGGTIGAAYLEIAYDDEFDVIPLTDKILLDSKFKKLENNNTEGPSMYEHFMFLGSYGPCVTKEIDARDNSSIYTVAGIVIRTVDELQNIMNICGVNEIADNITIK